MALGYREFFGLEFFGGVEEAVYIEHAGNGASAKLDILAIDKGLE